MAKQNIAGKSIDITGLLLILYAFSLSLPITFPWTILIIGMISMLMLIISEKVKKNESILDQLQTIFSGQMIVPIAVFAIAVTVSGIANGGFAEGWRSLFSLRGMLVYLWACWGFRRNPKLIEVCVTAILVGGAIAGIIASIEQLTGFHPFSFRYMQGTGFLSGPMAFSGLAQLFTLLAAGLAFSGGYTKFKSVLASSYVFIPLLLANGLGLVFAGERSAWAGAAVALFAVSFLVSRKTAIISGVSILISPLLGFLVLPVVRERLTSLVHWQADASINARFILWQKAWQVFLQSPWFGCGIRYFPHLRIEEALQQGHAALDHAHNNYLHILATTGLVGLSAYLYLWLSALMLGYRTEKESKGKSLEQGIYLGLLGGLVSLAVSGLFEYNFGTGQVRLAQWFLLAMYVAAHQRAAAARIRLPK